MLLSSLSGFWSKLLPRGTIKQRANSYRLFFSRCKSYFQLTRDMIQWYFFSFFFFFLTRAIKWTPTFHFNYLSGLSAPTLEAGQRNVDRIVIGCSHHHLQQHAWTRVFPFLVFVAQLILLFPMPPFLKPELLQTKTSSHGLAECVLSLCAVITDCHPGTFSMTLLFFLWPNFFLPFSSPSPPRQSSQEVKAINSGQRNIILKELCSFSMLLITR